MPFCAVLGVSLAKLAWWVDVCGWVGLYATFFVRAGGSSLNDAKCLLRADRRSTTTRFRVLVISHAVTLGADFLCTFCRPPSSAVIGGKGGVYSYHGRRTHFLLALVI